MLLQNIIKLITRKYLDFGRQYHVHYRVGYPLKSQYYLLSYHLVALEDWGGISNMVHRQMFKISLRSCMTIKEYII